MPIQTIYRGVEGDSSKKFTAGSAFDTCQENDDYLNYVDTVAALAMLSLSVGDKKRTKGCLSIGDGGHGDFVVEVAGTTPNGYSRILLANGNHAVLQQINGTYNTKQFGQDLELAVIATKGNNATLRVIDTVYVDGDEIIIDQPMTLTGDGRGGSKIVFRGSPAKTIRTYAVWRVEYDSGVYTNSSDAAVACGIIIKSTNVFITDVEIQAEFDPNENFPLPFNSATDYPASNYDYGILVQSADVSLIRIKVTGPWGLTGETGGVCIDVTQPSGAPEHIKIHDSELHGRYGLLILGPHGAGAAPNYSDMVFDDIRGAGGVSDFEVIGSQIYDTQMRLIIDGTGKRPKRFAFGGGGGALFIDGQISRNSAKRQQHIRFVNTRFANVDDYTIYLNFCHRVDFIGCHTEFRGGSYLEDGVTLNSASYMYGRTITVNARSIDFVSGDRSGEPDTITYTSGTERIVSELGLDDKGSTATKTSGRMVGGLQLRDRGLWTPTMAGSSTPGAPVFSTAVGTYTKFANFVYITGRLVCTSLGGMNGNITIGGLPYTASELLSASSGDGSVTFGLLSNVTFGSQLAGIIDEGTKNIILIKCNTGAASATLTHSDLTATFTIQFSAIYLTEEP